MAARKTKRAENSKSQAETSSSENSSSQDETSKSNSSQQPALASVSEEAAALAREEISQRKFSPSAAHPPRSFYPNPEHVIVLDLGNEGSAVVGMAIAAGLNYLHAESGRRQLVSSRMLYEFARLYDEWPGTDYEGSSLIGGLAGLMQAGSCLDKDWPWQKDRPSRQTLKRALQNRPHAVLRVDPLPETLRAAIFEYHAVVVSTAIHDGWQRPRDGRIPYAGTEASVGDIAIVLLGYTEQGYIVQNAWGERWGGVAIGASQVGGLAIWTYEDAARNLKDAWVIELERPVQRAPLVGYDADALDGEDLLDISEEVNAFSYVLASRAIKPPLALGLFGDWGSGKSFFMQEMCNRIGSLAQPPKNKRRNRRARTDSPFCQNIVQIRFNAWHYLDANLWASLVTEIFDRLFESIGGSSGKPEEKLPGLAEELRAANGVYQQAKQQLDDAERARHKAELQLQHAIDQRRQRETGIQTQLDDLKALLTLNPVVQVRLQWLAEDLGLPELQKSYTEVEAQVSEIRGLGRRFNAIVHSMFARRWSWPRLLGLVAALLTPVMVVAVTELVQSLGDIELQALQSAGVQISSLFAAIAAWLGTQARRGASMLNSLQATFQELEQIRRDRRAVLLNDQQGELQALRDKEEAARRSAQEAELQVQTLKREIEELQPGRLIMRFIEERSQSSDYRSRLGIVSLVRRDFERLSELSNPDSSQYNKTLMPVERIILYIDDLDRCRPERVIEVLEAVHLLLAFRLFMVVVAVDPRWLRRCLEKHYPDLLVAGGADPSLQAHAMPSRPATAQDYLEKIFQIPFTLQPLREQGYRRLVQGLTEINRIADLVATTDQQPAAAGEQSATTTLSAIERQQLREQAKQSARASLQKQAQEALSVESETSAIERLQIRDWELRDMERLAELFHTPRSVKRFVNTYRFLRASVRPQYLARFEGTKDAPGAYRAAMTLLAIVIGHANVASQFLRLLLDLAEDEACAWSEFLQRARGSFDDKAAEYSPAASDQTAAAAFKQADVEATVEPAPYQRVRPANAPAVTTSRPDSWQQLEWRQLCDRLLAVTDGDFPVTQASELKEWIYLVSRFSFSLSSLARVQPQVKADR